MSQKKRAALFLACICVLLIFLVACSILLTGNAAKKEAGIDEKRTDATGQDGKGGQEAGSGKGKMEFEDFYLLESYFTVKQIEGLEGEIREFLGQVPEYGKVGEVTCRGEMASTENRLEFYCVLDDGEGTALRAVYDRTSGKFRFWTDTLPQEEIGQELTEKQERIVKTGDWEEEEKLPSEWTYEEEDNTPVTMSGKNALEGKIPEEHLARLEEEILSFLRANNEYRREIEIRKSPKDTAIAVEFWGEFKTSRLDKKELHAVYDKSRKSYQFTFQEE